jgi:ribosome biogenesis GTPase / thiamine phosphate phosphatase
MDFRNFESSKQGILEGIVIKSTGSLVTVKTASGEKISCRLKGQFRIRGIRSTNPLAIGDIVDFDREPGDGSGMITAIHERNNYIIRKATKLSKASHIIAANLDQAWLVATLADPKTSTGFIDRFLVTATGYYIPAGIIFNKIDIYDDALLALMDELTGIYTHAGYACISVSALRGDRIPELRDNLAGKVSLFAGHSGVGKSALLKAIDPALNPKIGDISDVHRKGMHTTTFTEMYELDNGGFIVDTPGIREFGLVHFDREEIPRCFPEMDRLLDKCQFKNCTHVHEPGCAVLEALETGEVSLLRYNSYLSILNDD